MKRVLQIIYNILHRKEIKEQARQKQESINRERSLAYYEKLKKDSQERLDREKKWGWWGDQN